MSRFKTEERFAGRVARCPNCENQLNIPAAPAPPPPPAPAATKGAPQAAGPPPMPVGPVQPGKLKAVGIMSLCGGVYATLLAIGTIIFILVFGVATLGFGLIVGVALFVPIVYSLAMGILAIVNGALLLAGKLRGRGLPMTAAIMQIVNIISCDLINLVLGIINLTFLSNPEVKAYFRR
jgi:hypothetical protein